MERTRQQEPVRISIVRNYQVPPEKVWRSWTEPQVLIQWFGPGNGWMPSFHKLDNFLETRQ